MAEEEAQNQEQNAEATEAVEAGAEAVEEVAVAEPKAPSILMPMLLSALITVVGVGVMVAVILPKQIAKAVAGASHGGSGEHKEGEGKEGEGKEGEGHGEGGDHGEGDDHGEGEKKEGDDAAATAEEDDPEKPEPIVAEGTDIVINPADSAGRRYLLVEIFLLRKEVKDTGFPAQVKKKTKELQAVTVDLLSGEDVQALAQPATKDRLKAQLKLAYQAELGTKHPIEKLVVSKWIMQ